MKIEKQTNNINNNFFAKKKNIKFFDCGSPSAFVASCTRKTVSGRQ